MGKEARRFTTNLLRGESVYLDYEQQKQDRYGRTLAYPFRGVMQQCPCRPSSRQAPQLKRGHGVQVI
jgi:endonuclease YncB( thermonuclease family)